MKKRSEMRIQMAIARAKRTALGRAFCRLAGNRVGGVMLEYVMLAVLVSAAVAALVWWLGGTLQGGIKTAGQSVFSPTTSGDTYAKEKQRSSSAGEKADVQREKFDTK